MDTKDTRAFEKSPGLLQLDKRKDGSASEIAELHLFQDQVCRGFSSFETPGLRIRTVWHSAYTGPATEVLPRMTSHLCVQRLLHP